MEIIKTRKALLGLLATASALVLALTFALPQAEASGSADNPPPVPDTLVTSNVYKLTASKYDNPTSRSGVKIEITQATNGKRAMLLRVDRTSSFEIINESWGESALGTFYDYYEHSGLIYGRSYTYYAINIEAARDASTKSIFTDINGNSCTFEQYVNSMRQNDKPLNFNSVAPYLGQLDCSVGATITTQQYEFPEFTKFSCKAISPEYVAVTWALSEEADEYSEPQGFVSFSVNGVFQGTALEWSKSPVTTYLEIPYGKTATISSELSYNVYPYDTNYDESVTYTLQGKTATAKGLSKPAKSKIGVTKLSKNVVMISVSKHAGDSSSRIYHTVQVKVGKKWKTIKSRFGNKKTKSFFTYKATKASKRSYRVISYYKDSKGKWHKGNASSAKKSKSNVFVPKKSRVSEDDESLMGFTIEKIYYSKGKLKVKGVAFDKEQNVKKMKMKLLVKCQGKQIAEQKFTIKNVKKGKNKKVTLTFKKAKKKRDLRNGDTDYFISTY